MRKFRFIDPTSIKGRNQVIGQALKFIIGWNVLGFALWQTMKKVTRDKDPESFNSKTKNEQMLVMMGHEPKVIQKYKYAVSMKGVNKVPQSDSTEPIAETKSSDQS